MDDISPGSATGNASAGLTPQFLTTDPATGEKLIYVCHGKNCGRSCRFLMDRLKQVRDKGYKFRAEPTICMDRCEEGPNVRVGDQIYTHMNPIKVSELAKKISPRVQ